MLTPKLAHIHFAYSAWASHRLVEAATLLSPEELTRDHGTADKSVLGTLVHAFVADRVWLSRVRGETATSFIEESGHSLDVLRQAWPEVYSGWLEWLDHLPENGLDAPIGYSDMKGRPWENPGWQIVLHVVNHATHHRGQVAGFLRAMGHKPPPLDMTAMWRGM